MIAPDTAAQERLQGISDPPLLPARIDAPNRRARNDGGKLTLHSENNRLILFYLIDRKKANNNYKYIKNRLCKNT
jgi:hypothetical protein